MHSYAETEQIRFLRTKFVVIIIPGPITLLVD